MPRTNTIDVSASNFSHGELSGLLADDHPQYLPTDGSRAMSGDLTTDGVASMQAVRVNGVTPGLPNTITLTNNTQTLQQGNGAKLGAIPGPGGGSPTKTHMAGWLRLYVGDTLAAIPYWI
ncbi:MAG: hypothetical protein ACPGXK_17105 [Phycisphaerae bacterium]